MPTLLPPLLTQQGLPIGFDPLRFSEAITDLSGGGYANEVLLRSILDSIPFLTYADPEDESTEPATLKIDDTINCLVAILERFSKHSSICMRTLNAIQWVVLNHKMEQVMCEALVKTLQVRILLSQAYILDEEYRKGFDSLVPEKLKGCDGVWREVFDYYYPSKENAAQVLRLCLSVIRDLTRSNTVQNRNSLIAAGACEIIPSLFATHVADTAITHECCKAVIVLAHAGRERLILSGACAGVVKAIVLHADISFMALNGCRAIYALSVDNVEGRDGMVKAGACSALVGLLTLHFKDKNIVREGCLAVYRLSVQSPQNKISFFEAGFCETLMLIYRVHGQSNEINVRGLIRDFVNGNVAITDRFVALGACEVIPGLTL